MPEEHDEPFIAEQEAWEYGRIMLMEVRGHRGLSCFANKVEPATAEAMINGYCRRLRRSQDLALAKIQREYRLSNDDLMCLLAVFLNHLGMQAANGHDFYAVTLLACGISPCRMLNLKRSLDAGGLSRLVGHDQAWNLFPTPLLISLFFPKSLQQDEVAALKAELTKLPVANRRGLPDDKPRADRCP